MFSKNMYVDEVTIDANANWIPVDKPLDSKDDEGSTAVSVHLYIMF